MSDKKISQLTSLAQNDVVVSTDVLPIVDTSATETKKIAVNALVGAAAAAGLTNVDINSGTIDGVTIATSDITVGSGKTLNVSAGTLTLADNQISGDKVEGGTINAITINTLTSTAVNATTVDATNVEVTNVKAKDGTAAATIADSTGIVSLSANPILSGGTANGVLYLNGSKVATSGSALVFDGANKLTLFRSTATEAQEPTVEFSNKTFATQNPAVVKSANGGLALDIQSPSDATFQERSRIYMNGGATSTVIFQSSSNNGSTYSDRMALTSTGLGIGTSSPAAKLDVKGGSTISTLAGWNTLSTAMFQLANPAVRFGIGYDSSDHVLLQAFDSSNAARELALQVYGGNVGIGTSSPADKLQVLGAIRFGANATFYGTITHDASVTGANIYNHVDSGGHLFQVGGSTLMNLTASGNLGLGVTPSAWSLGKALQIGTNGAATLLGYNNSLYLIANAYYDGSWKYTDTAAAGRYQLEAGIHSWWNAPSGTAGNAISFTQAMTLDASGNLNVGTTGINSNFRLNLKSPSGNGGIVFSPDTNGATVPVLRMLNAASDTNVGEIGTASATAMYFSTGGTERARITSGGYFKASNAGTYQDSAASYHEFRQSTADVAIVYNTNTNASSPYGVRVHYTAAAPNGTDNWFFFAQDNTSTRAVIRSNGGLANYQANNVDLSDARTKKEITPASSMWDKIGALEIVTYKYNDQTHDDVNVGVIAQQVEAVEPVWVDNDGFGETPEGEEPLKTVYTKDIYFAAIKALQEAMARIEKLEAEMAALKGA